jgi:2-methylcitrate dehydratase PrpD
MARATAIPALGEGASRRMADHVARLRYETLPQGVLHAFKRALLDFVTCAIAGSAMPVSRALLSYFEGSDATRSATVIGSGVKLSASNAAMVNGANVHGLDFDDGHTHGSAHPAGVSSRQRISRRHRTPSSCRSAECMPEFRPPS